MIRNQNGIIGSQKKMELFTILRENVFQPKIPYQSRETLS